MDFGFGDAVTPYPEECPLPTLIGGVPAPRLRVYPLVASVAEKFEIMVYLGRRNSRMKDFHDIWALSDAFAFEGATLRDATSRCFERRGTRWTTELPDALGPAFYSDADVGARWRAYQRAGGFRVPPPAAIAEIGERVRAFLGPVRESILAGIPFEMRWPSGGPWQPGTRRGEGSSS